MDRVGRGMEFLMDDSERGRVVDPELEKALSDLLAQTAREPISPRLRELVLRLEAALEKARRQG